MRRRGKATSLLAARRSLAACPWSASGRLRPVARGAVLAYLSVPGLRYVVLGQQQPGVVQLRLVQPGGCRRGDRLDAALVVRILSINRPCLRRHSVRWRVRSSSADLTSPITQQRRSTHSLHLLTQPSGSECTEKVEGKIKGGGTSLAWKAVCTGVGDGTQSIHLRAAYTANLRQHWP